VFSAHFLSACRRKIMLAGARGFVPVGRAQTHCAETISILPVPTSPSAVGRQARPVVALKAFQQNLATGDLVQLGSAGALAFSAVTPLVAVLLFATSPPIAHSFPEAAAVTALYLPLHVRHVRYRTSSWEQSLGAHRGSALAA
jgi:hypothetical protein